MTTTLRDLTTLHALPQGAQYRYDQLNRISAMDVWQDLDISANAWDVSAPLLDYQTRYHYDANGNLLKLKRNAQSATTLAMDDFTYHYAPTNNQLTHVNDAVPATNHTQDIDDQISGNYSYDPSGNLIADQAEFIQHISWTTYGKVQSIQRVIGSGRPNLHFEYGADGQRITKQTTYFPPGVATADSTVFQFYVRDAQGNVMATYNIRPTTNAPLFLSDHSLYGSARIGQRQQPKIVNQGYVPPGTNNLVGVTYVQRGWKAYELSNHLGNVLSVISDRREAGQCNDTLVAFYYPDIIQNNDYYPFGAPMEGRSQQNRKYRYGFNGQEKDNEVYGEGNSYTAEFWQYDSRLALRWNTDPKPHPSLSYYHTFGGNPIWQYDGGGDTPSVANRNRMGGLLKLTFGLTEAFAGATITATGVGAVPGVVVLIHGSDVSASGIMQIITGENQETLTQRGISGALQSSGVNPKKANAIASGIDEMIPLLMGVPAAQTLIKSSSKRLMPRVAAQQINRTGAAKGVTVPKGWITQASKKGGGTVFKDPSNPHNIIRQMPGNPNSPNILQQNPHVKFMKEGKFYDVNGKVLPNGDVPGAHIPLNLFDINKMPKF
jgi:hypothetical protein